MFRRKSARRYWRLSLKTSFLMTALLFLIPFALYGGDNPPTHATTNIQPSTDVPTTDNVPAAESETPDSSGTPDNGSAPDNAPTTDNVPTAESGSAWDDTQVSVDAFSIQSGERDAERILRVRNHKTGNVERMDLGTYLTGVLRGEMPVSFEEEALKAQAVAARTYTRYMLRSGGKHGGNADICTDSHCCQAYAPDDGYADETKKLRAAVDATDGEIMLYDGVPVLAVFHSASAGLTRPAEDVWSGGKPYLRPVVSPENPDETPNYYSRVEFTADEFRTKVHAAEPSADLSGPMSSWLSDAQRDSAGSILTVNVGGIAVQGSKVRTMLDLRSACFTWEVEDGKLVFSVTGFGHGVGLSQYGANQMAKEGADYRTILSHYYTGITIGGYLP